MLYFYHLLALMLKRLPGSLDTEILCCTGDRVRSHKIDTRHFDLNKMEDRSQEKIEDDNSQKRCVQ